MKIRRYYYCLKFNKNSYKCLNLFFVSLFGLSALILGAFGSHALKEMLTSEQLLSFETVVRYQMHHPIVLLFVAIFEGFSIKQ